MIKNIDYKRLFKQYFLILLGTFIFCFGTNLFIVPINLYNGGVVGISQLIRTVLIDYLGFNKNIEIAGIINLLLNIPLLIIAFAKISKNFFIKTLFSIIFQTVFFTLIPIPKTPVLEDVLAGCVIGGVISGLGIGIILRASGCGGGIDILGFYFSSIYKNFSIGKLSIIINAILYAICAFMFNVETAIYSVIYIIAFSFIIDKTHLQNINTMVIVFTKNKDVPQKILYEMGRGVTSWNGNGAYTKEDTLIFITVISKYEVNQIKEIIYEKDEKAFIIFSEGNAVLGNFEKRL